MKKRVLSTALLFVLATAAWAAPTFGLGGGLLFLPGTYDPVLLTKYDSLNNDAGVTLVNPGSPPPRFYGGVRAFAEVRWLGILARLDGALASESGIQFYYDQSGSRFNVLDESLLVSATLWAGPCLSVGDAGSVYACVGPSWMYGEYRKKQQVDGNDAESWDRQFTGSGFVFPVMVGAEVRVLPALGIALEGVYLGQQIVIQTTGKENFASATAVDHESMLFPGFGLFSQPAAFWIQLSATWHF